MKLLEYEAKEIFRNFRIPTPDGDVASSPGEAEAVAERLGRPVAVKAQLPVGGRGRLGGILFAETPAEAANAAERLIGSMFKGVEVRKVLVEEKLHIDEEFFLGVAVDRHSRSYAALASSEGGVDIEEVALRTPDKIVRYPVDPIQGFRPYNARWIIGQLGRSGREMVDLAGILLKLYKMAVENDAELCEINPLAATSEGFIAADARLNLDNNALYRHRDLEKRYGESELTELTKRELEARRLGLIYVELVGNIGVIGNGAGLTMATADMVTLNGGRAGDFLDLGGGAPSGRVETAVSFVISDPNIDGLLVNILGGITRCDDIARGIIAARRGSGVEKPIVVRMMGTNEKEGKRLLRDAGIDTFETMEESAESIVRIVGGS